MISPDVEQTTTSHCCEGFSPEDGVSILYNSPPKTRNERANYAKSKLDFLDKKKEFAHFILDQYINHGFKELDNEKLPKLINLKYQSINNARKELGDIDEIRQIFISVQEKLYLS